MVPLIVKRDSRLEPFDIEKVKRVVKAAGLTEEQTNKLVDKVSQWIHSINLEQLHSLKLRDKVQEEMHLLNKSAANLFAWYQKTKEQHS